jgi:hypothetical protein
MYTSYKSSLVDSQIASRVRLITEIILENVPYVRSVLLTGGFGKGEGSVKKTNDGKIICLRDFDIAVVVDRIPKEKVVRKLYDQIYRSLNLTNPEYMLFRFSNFVVDIKFLRKKDLIYPDIWFYDLKAASQLLYGEDLRTSISWGKEEIPLSSGLRILFEKASGLLGVFSYADCLKTEKPSEENKELLIFECYKTFIEMCTALCILANRYEPKYADRARTFEKLYLTEFPELVEVVSDLPKKVVACTSFKLKPDFTQVNEDPVDLWFSTRYYLSVILRFYIKRYLGITTLNWKNLPSYTKNVARNYYKPFLNSVMYANLSSSNRIFLDIASFLYQTLTNIEYSYVVTRNVGRLYLYPLRRCYVSPSLKFFTASIMLLFSLNRDGTVEKELFQKAAEELRHCIPLEISTIDSSGWDGLRRHFLKAYSLYRGYHFVK